MTTLEKLINIFLEVVDSKADASAITLETGLIDDLKFNSIKLLYMAIALEEAFSVTFTNEDLNSFKTVGDVVGCIDGRRKD